MSESLSALIGDVFSVASWPGGNLAGLALKKLFDARLRTSRDILFAELATGAITPGEAATDESVAIVYRFLRSAQEGAARLNLRLLAAVFAGQVRERAIAADDFLYYADMLASLRRDEIILLGALLRTSATHPSRPEDDFSVKMAANHAARHQLVPSVFSDNEHFNAVANSLQRTGLLLAVPIGTNFAGVGVQYKPTVLLDRLNALAKIEGVIERDGESVHRDPASE